MCLLYLTEGESGFEEALLDALAREEQLLNPAELFKTDRAAGELDTEDASYWNVEVAVKSIAEEAGLFEPDPLIETALQLGGTAITPETSPTPFVFTRPEKLNGTLNGNAHRLLEAVNIYLDTVHLVTETAHWTTLQAQLLEVLAHGIQVDDGLPQVIGLYDSAWLPEHEVPLTAWVSAWLKRERVVFTGCEGEVAAEIVHRATAAQKRTPGVISVKQVPVQHTRMDRLAIPDEAHEALPAHPSFRTRQPHTEGSPVQLALF